MCSFLQAEKEGEKDVKVHEEAREVKELWNNYESEFWIRRSHAPFALNAEFVSGWEKTVFVVEQLQNQADSQPLDHYELGELKIEESVDTRARLRLAYHACEH